DDRGMALPRQILSGETYLVTRRCAERRFFLVPSPMCRRVFGYCLAHAQAATGVKVHAGMVLSNHYHLVVTDPCGRLPKFTEILNQYVAKCMNDYHGRYGNLFEANEQTSHVRLADDTAKLEKLVYTMTNPVAAGLVSSHSRWPGFAVV